MHERFRCFTFINVMTWLEKYNSLWIQLWENIHSSCCLKRDKGGRDKYRTKHISTGLLFLSFTPLTYFSCYRIAKLFVFWTLRTTKHLSRGDGMEGWDHPAAASSPALTPTSSSLHALLYSSCSCSLSLCHRKFLSSSVCPRDTKMDGEAPGTGCTIACATRWAASAAYGPERFFFLTAARLLLWLQKKCVRRRRRIWAAQYGNRCFCSARSLKGGLGWGA